MYLVPRKEGTDESTASSSTSFKDQNIVLFRAPIFSMLKVKDEKPILFKLFTSPLPGYVPQVTGKTLGARRRMGGGPSVLAAMTNPIPVFGVPEEQQQQDSKKDWHKHKLTLWKQDENEMMVDGEKPVEPIVVDPDLSKVLREHQRQGVQFVFDCLMGLRDYNGCGCILADDMGLGKTLQSVTIALTLLTQGITNDGQPAVRKALVVCPASLVKNWGNEFDKWTNGKVKYQAITESGKERLELLFKAFKYDRTTRVLIASYETFRNYMHCVVDCPFDLVIADEAHRLKNDKTKTAQCIMALPAKRRLLLTGTPIQNDLDEFFALVSLSNPGIFGGNGEFRKKFAMPIYRGREPDAQDHEKELANSRLEELSDVTNQFILRRTNKLLARVLPPKLMLNVFCPLAPFALKVYQLFLTNKKVESMAENATSMAGKVLGSIQNLMKLVNHPYLIRKPTKEMEYGFEKCESMFELLDEEDKAFRGINKPMRPFLSGKMYFVYKLLKELKPIGDRVVLISNWTMTLDVLQNMCAQNNWPVVRLDGSMGIKKRQKIVDTFNDPHSMSFVFLLSSKAGGCGINLIGANRLVMFDPDWNPANDKQAMARVWRDGQKKMCYIYRLFTTGTLEEKMYQRQILKDGLSSMLVVDQGDIEEGAKVKETLSADQVRDLFNYKHETLCDTLEMLKVPRCWPDIFGEANKENAGAVPEKLPHPLDYVPQEVDYLEDDLLTWGHHKDLSTVDDPIFKAAVTLDAKEQRQMKTIADLGPRMKLPPQTCPGTLASFAMSCRVEFTPEQIKRMEEADAKKLKARQDNNKKEHRDEQKEIKKKKDAEREAKLDAGEELDTESDPDDEDFVEEKEVMELDSSDDEMPQAKRRRRTNNRI